jgi:hypothetical protein
VVEASEGTGERGGRIALDHYHVRIEVCQQPVEAPEGACGDISEALAMMTDAKVVISHDPEGR